MLHVEEDHIESSKFKKLQTTWSNGDVVPFEAMFVSPSQCHEATLDALLSHSEFISRMDPEDAATATEDEYNIKLDFVEGVLGTLEVEGKLVWLVSQDYNLSKPSEEFVIVRVSSILLSVHCSENATRLLEQATFVRMRAPAR